MSKTIKSLLVSSIILFAVNCQSARAVENGKQILDHLRSQLRYKFVLDYLIQWQNDKNIYATVEK
ncbi:MAG TPA: hypothetical protein VKI62_02585, partial [Bacteroidota bacterium]|nr:hypothetical protein [Bacteroidota bacterium]